METLQIERSGSIARITLRRPRTKNAIDHVMRFELIDVLADIARNPDRDRVVVLTGAAGDFSSGADLSGADQEDHPLTDMASITDLCLALHRLPQPTIAKVRGVAVGAGLNLALACDLVAAAPDARLCEIFAKRGLSVDAGGSWLLPRLVGPHRAKELVLLADFVSGTEAAAMGLINRSVPDDELDALVDGWAARLAEGPPIALRQSKLLLNQAWTSTYLEALDAEASAVAVNNATTDTQEAIAAFLDKRTPRFEGR